MKSFIASAAILTGLGTAACAEESSKALKAEIVAELPKAKEISVDDASTLQRSGTAIIIDVRREREWKSIGMAEDAIGITLQDADFLDQILAAADGDKSRPIALICRSGSRSSKAQKKLEAEGYTTVINVAGGTLAWKKQGLPMQDYAAD